MRFPPRTHEAGPPGSDPAQSGHAERGVPTTSQAQEAEYQLWLVLLAIAAFFVALRSPIDHAGSDPKGTLLTAQAILSSGSARLDEYATQDNSWVAPHQPGRFSYRHGHVYYRHPMTPVLLSAPFVWMANLQGMDLFKPTTDAAVQNVLSALLVVSAVVLAFSLSGRFVQPGIALLLTTGFVFGGPLMSTAGTALWNSGIAAVLGLASIIILTDMGMGRKASPTLLATLLVLCAFCRPTMLVLAGLAAAYACLVRRRVFPRFLGLLVGLACLALLAHRHLYDGFVLDYYSSSRLARPWWFLLALGGMAAGAVALGTRLIKRRRVRGRARTPHPESPADPTSPANGLRPERSPRNASLVAYALGLGVFACGVLFVPRLLNRSGVTHSSFLPNQREVIDTLRAVYGVLLSPSRGLLVYSPYLVLTVCGLVVTWQSVRRTSLFWLAATWLVLHTVIVARPLRWHGGHCFGSRMYLDAFPALMILTLLVWNGVSCVGRRSRFARALLAVTIAVSVFINVYQGMFNRWTVVWNREPDVDTHTEYLLNWRYPQFLASPGQLEARMEEHDRRLTGRTGQMTTALPRGPRSAPCAAGDALHR